VGTYPLDSAKAAKFRITTRENKLYAKFGSQIEAEILPESETSFFYTIIDAKIKFIKDEAGKVTKLILYQNRKEIGATKE
jgi:hypothetical protein